MNIINLQKQFIDADPLALLDTKVVSAYTGLSISWFNNKAVYGDGIPFLKLINKRLYKKIDVLMWLEKHGQKVNSTSEYQCKGGDHD